jgi:hypothetical protein
MLRLLVNIISLGGEGRRELKERGPLILFSPLCSILNSCIHIPFSIVLSWVANGPPAISTADVPISLFLLFGMPVTGLRQAASSKF